MRQVMEFVIGMSFDILAVLVIAVLCLLAIYAIVGIVLSMIKFIREGVEEIRYDYEDEYEYDEEI